MKAIVLLGSHGAGKDTVANALIEQYPKCFYNAKFSRLLKEITANAYYANTKQMEKKHWRDIPGMYGVAPIDVLNALFYGSAHVPKLAESILDSCISSIPSDTIPIFTDVRRDIELQKVLDTYTEDNVVVVRLLRSSSKPDDTDNYLNATTINFTHVNNDGSIDKTVEELIKLLGLKPPEPVYKIHMYYTPYAISVNPKYSLLDYSSNTFDLLLLYFREVFENHEDDLLLELVSESLTTAFNIGLLPYINKDNLPTESYVELSYNFPKSLVKHFREKVKLVWHYRVNLEDKIAHLVEPEDEVVEYDS
jgi:ribose 1,5-bisphosphokinase PhnN